MEATSVEHAAASGTVGEFTESFSGLRANEHYTFVALKTVEAEDVFGSENLLFITDVMTDANGCAEVRYIPDEAYSGAVTMMLRTSRDNIAYATVEIADEEYTGETIFAFPYVYMNGEQLAFDEDYTFSGYRATGVGEYEMTIYGLGEYNGMKHASFNVVDNTGSGSTDDSTDDSTDGSTGDSTDDSTGDSTDGSTDSSTGGWISGGVTFEPTYPIVNGEELTWSEIASYIRNGKITDGTSLQLNGNCFVPTEIQSAMNETGIKLDFVYNDAYTWNVDGAEFTGELAESNLIVYTRGVYIPNSILEEIDGTAAGEFAIKNKMPTRLTANLGEANTGKFVNLYIYDNYKLKYVGASKIDKDGKAVLGAVGKSTYVMILDETVHAKMGDANGDGVVNSNDAAAILKYAVGIEALAVPEACDINGDGMINAVDASMLLKIIVGIIADPFAVR